MISDQAWSVRSSDNFVHSLRMNVGPVSSRRQFVGETPFLTGLQQENAGSAYRSYMTQGGRVEVDKDGWGIFTCFPEAVQVWVREGDDQVV